MGTKQVLPPRVRVEPGIHGNEEVLHIPKSSRTKVIYEALCFDVAQGQINEAPNVTRTHSCRFASLAC